MDRLCAGTFFRLLSDSKRPQKNYGQRYQGVRSGTSDSDLYMALGECVRGEPPEYSTGTRDVVKTQASILKNCTGYGGPICNFRDPAVRKAFQEQVQHHYMIPLSAMCDLVSTFLDVAADTRKDEHLVLALIGLILHDSKISESQLFYIFEDGHPCSKAELRHLSSVTVQPFLLGVWEYALCHVNVKDGADTVKRWKDVGSGYISELEKYGPAAVGLVYCDKPVLLTSDSFTDCSNDNAPPEISATEEGSPVFSPAGNDSVETDTNPCDVNFGCSEDHNFGNHPSFSDCIFYNFIANDFVTNEFNYNPDRKTGHLYVQNERALESRYTSAPIISKYTPIYEDTGFYTSVPCFFIVWSDFVFRQRIKSSSAYLGKMTRLLDQGNGYYRIDYQLLGSFPAGILTTYDRELGLYTPFFSTPEEEYENDSYEIVYEECGDSHYEYKREHWSVKQLPLLEILADLGVQITYFDDVPTPPRSSEKIVPAE
ncbi:MAG: hypothetical protein KBS46_03760 [Clostridiales bacterium]|nr:hypothetical protein [Candidatus Apopatocola equi]